MDRAPKYAEVKVDLSDHDGNAFAIIGSVRKALRRAGVSPNLIDDFAKEARSGDYDHLLRTVMDWVTVE